MNSIQLLVAILMLTPGCMTDADRDLYQKITVPCKIVAINPTEYRWDNITVEFPTGQRFRVQVPRGMYQTGEVFSKQIWKWRAIELGIKGDS